MTVLLRLPLLLEKAARAGVWGAIAWPHGKTPPPANIQTGRMTYDDWC